MSFQILNYLPKLNNVEYHNTWIKAECPICKGILKIASSGAKIGAFACYTSDCHKIRPNPIVKELTKDEFRPKKSLYSTRQIRIPNLSDIITPLHFKLTEDNAKDFFSAETYKPPWSDKSPDGDEITIYNYDDFKLVRIKPLTEKKFFYFRVKKEGVWINEVPTTFKNVPVYRSNYLSSSVIFCEGEKVASYLQKLQLNAVSFPSFVYQESYLAKFLRCLSYKVKNIVYLTDNDDTGKQKADKFLKEAWKSGINSNSCNIAELLGRGTEKNYDAADAIDEKIIATREDLMGLLLKCNTQKA